MSETFCFEIEARKLQVKNNFMFHVKELFYCHGRRGGGGRLGRGPPDELGGPPDVLGGPPAGRGIGGGPFVLEEVPVLIFESGGAEFWPEERESGRLDEVCEFLEGGGGGFRELG